MTLALTILVPVGVGLLVFYVLMRQRMPAIEARAAWWRFALVWTPAAVAITIVAELVWH